MDPFDDGLSVGGSLHYQICGHIYKLLLLVELLLYTSISKRELEIIMKMIYFVLINAEGFTRIT